MKASQILADYNYQTAAEFYRLKGDDSALKFLLSLPKTEFTESKLKAAIQAMAAAETPAQNAVANKEEKEKPATLEQLRYEAHWKPLYIEAAKLHQSISNQHLSEAERKEIAFAILDKFDKLAVLEQQREHIEQHGKPPETRNDTDISKLTLDQLFKRRLNLRTYISRFANKPHRADDVAAWREELTLIEAKLANVIQ